MKHLLLTGGQGSIGAQVIIDVMENTDWRITLLSSFHHKGYRDRLQRILKDCPEWASRITEFEHNLACPISSELCTRIGQVDYGWHLAALSDVFFSVENPV